MMTPMLSGFGPIGELFCIVPQLKPTRQDEDGAFCAKKEFALQIQRGLFCLTLFAAALIASNGLVLEWFPSGHLNRLRLRREHRSSCASLQDFNIHFDQQLAIVGQSTSHGGNLRAPLKFGSQKFSLAFLNPLLGHWPRASPT